MPRLVLAVLASAAALAPAAPLPKEAARPPLYFPVQVGAKWVYKTDHGRGEEAIAVTAVERVGDEHVVTRTAVEPNAILYSKVAVSAAGLRHVGDDADAPPVWLLKVPFKGGDTWRDGTPGGQLRTVHGPEEVTVLAGTYRAVRVVRHRSDGHEEIVHWYAAGVGEVKRVFREADGTETVRRALASFTPGKD